MKGATHRQVAYRDVRTMVHPADRSRDKLSTYLMYWFGIYDPGREGHIWSGEELFIPDIVVQYSTASYRGVRMGSKV